MKFAAVMSGELDSLDRDVPDAVVGAKFVALASEFDNAGAVSMMLSGGSR